MPYDGKAIKRTETRCHISCAGEALAENKRFERKRDYSVLILFLMVAIPISLLIILALH